MIYLTRPEPLVKTRSTHESGGVQMKPLKVGIIGAGGHAQSHFSMVIKEQEMDLVAVAELDKERLESVYEKYGPFQTFFDYRTMLDSCDLDVVYVITMPGHLTGPVIDCLDRGLHTSIEKPAGMTSEDTEQMLAASLKSSGKAIVSVNRRYMPHILAAKQLILSRGGAVHVAATYNKPVTVLGTAATEGIAPAPIICDAIHHVDLLRWMSGEAMDKAADPLEVYAQSWSGQREGSFRYNAMVAFENGSRGVMMSHYGVGYRIQRFEAHAEDLSIYMDLTGSPVVEVYSEGTVVEDALDLNAVGGPDFDETRHFVECIRENKEPWSTLGDVVQTMRLCEHIASGTLGKTNN